MGVDAAGIAGAGVSKSVSAGVGLLGAGFGGGDRTEVPDSTGLNVVGTGVGSGVVWDGVSCPTGASVDRFSPAPAGLSVVGEAVVSPEVGATVGGFVATAPGGVGSAVPSGGAVVGDSVVGSDVTGMPVGGDVCTGALVGEGVTTVGELV